MVVLSGNSDVFFIENNEFIFVEERVLVVMDLEEVGYYFGDDFVRLFEIF